MDIDGPRALATRSCRHFRVWQVRLERALRNFAETFPLFAAAVLVAGIANRHS